MAGYLERLKKYIPLPPTDKTDSTDKSLPVASEHGTAQKKSEIPLPPTDKTDKSPPISTFDSSVSFVSSGEGKKFLGRPSSPPPSVSSVSAPPRESEFFSSVRCSECRHAQPATPSDPWSWHLCGAGAIREHGWGMAPRRCERWETAPPSSGGSPEPGPDKPAEPAKPNGNGGDCGKDRIAAADALEAEGRRLLEEAKTAPSGVKVLPTGEMIEDPAPGSRADLRNRGNRLLEQARVMRLAEDEKRESPPADSPSDPDILADISTASPAESQGTPADPLATRVAELIAQGWALPNATARARSEAMNQTKKGARS